MRTAPRSLLAERVTFWMASSKRSRMKSAQEDYDDAIFDFSRGDYPAAIEKFKAILDRDPGFFDAQLSIGMAYYRMEDYATAVAEGKKAEKMRPLDQLVHTNLSLFHMKLGDKTTAEHHGLQARIASWRGNMTAPDPSGPSDPDLAINAPKTASAPKIPTKFPEMPWKKKAVPAGAPTAGDGHVKPLE